MRNKIIIYILGSLLVTLFNIVLVTVLVSGEPLAITGKLLGISISFASVVLWIKFLERYIKKPKELNIGLAVKTLMRSETFWGAFVIFALSIIREITGVDFDISNDSIKDLILGLDWSNVTQAILSLIVILVKYFDAPKLIDKVF